MKDSLDPRINRLPDIGNKELEFKKEPMDQFHTFEVFVQPKEGRPFQHEGIVHAPEEKMAFIFAKEQYSRRYSCSGIWIANTKHVKVSPYTENNQDIYDQIDLEPENEPAEAYEIFHLLRRGKQHKHTGKIEASGYQDAFMKAKENFKGDKAVLNVWIIKSKDIFKSKEEEKPIWDTLPLKQFREATDYKGSEKIREFKEKNK